MSSTGFYQYDFNIEISAKSSAQVDWEVRYITNYLLTWVDPIICFAMYDVVISLN